MAWDGEKIVLSAIGEAARFAVIFVVCYDIRRFKAVSAVIAPAWAAVRGHSFAIQALGFAVSRVRRPMVSAEALLSNTAFFDSS